MIYKIDRSAHLGPSWCAELSVSPSPVIDLFWPKGGLQAAEVMLYTIDKVNEMGIMPSGVTLGTHILDDCDKDTYGLQQAVDFIKGTLHIFSL